MNVALVFAGGIGRRMNLEIPKQFIKLYDKPIILHTIQAFENNENIDAIIVVMIDSWKNELQELLKKYHIKKVQHIVSGGETGQLSIFNGLKCAIDHYPDDSIILIHDGVRPFINNNLINENIHSVRKYGSAISSVYSKETNIILDEAKNIIEIPNKNNCAIAKAPQSFILKDIYKVHLEAQKKGIKNATDSASLMFEFDKKMHIIETGYDNIKITTPEDVELAKSIYNRNKVSSDE